MNARIDHLRFLSADAAPATTWLFVELRLEDATPGWGEATLIGQEAETISVARRLFPDLTAATTSRADLFDRLPFGSLPEAAVSSAVMQAFRDAEARRAGVPLADCLGGRLRDRVGLYANINRRTLDRTPAGMAQSALDARAAGFEAVKIAPFDEVHPDLDRAAMRAAMAPGLDRMTAVRDALGPAARLMVDCHWRFDEDGAAEMIRAAASLAPYWVECPVAEAQDQIGAICRLRKTANAAGIRLAGLETQIHTEGFRPYLTGGAYDVMMPDVKYAGGPDEMMRIAALLERHGVAVSPHNPTGPICHVHSLHICSALGASDLLEHQFDETPVFDALIGGGLPTLAGGVAAPCWDRPGLGVALADDPSLIRDIDLGTRGTDE